MKKLLLACSFISILLELNAQNGKIITKHRIQNFDAFIEYIRETESLDPQVYDTSRYRKFDRCRYQLLEKIELYGITYLSDGLKIKGFLLQPKKSGKFPAIIYNRGGSLEHGSLTHHVSSIGIGELARLANAGFVIAGSQYRGNGGSEGKEEYGGSDINDVVNLVPLLVNESKADTSRLGMFGWSRGGMTTFLTMKRTARGHSISIKAVAVGCPSTNLVRSIKDRPPLDEWWGSFIPNYNSPEKEEILKKRSAIYWVDELPKNIPLLVLQGGADRAVSPIENLEFVSRVQKAGIPNRFIMYENGDHGLNDYRDEVFEELTKWFRRYL